MRPLHCKSDPATLLPSSQVSEWLPVTLEYHPKSSPWPGRLVWAGSWLFSLLASCHSFPHPLCSSHTSLLEKCPPYSVPGLLHFLVPGPGEVFPQRSVVLLIFFKSLFKCHILRLWNICLPSSPYALTRLHLVPLFDCLWPAYPTEIYKLHLTLVWFVFFCGLALELLEHSKQYIFVQWMKGKCPLVVVGLFSLVIDWNTSVCLVFNPETIG